MFSSGKRLFLVRALISFLLTCAALLSLVPGTALAATAPPEIKADSYLVADLNTGRVLMSKDIDTACVPASLTKIMTMYVLFDAISNGEVSLDDMVPISELAWSTEGSKMYVLVGTEVKLEDLVKGVTVMSGNDACVAIAEHLAGNVQSFVDRMNEKARSLGLTQTHFVDPNGLSDDNRVSANDLLKLVTSYANVHPEAMPYHAIKEFAYTAPGERPMAPQFNRNRLLWSYPGTYGLKTGFTTKAGFNTVVMCERDGLNLVAILLGSARGKSIDDGERERTALVTSMLDWAYANYSYVCKAEPNTVVGKARVWKGKGKWVEAVTPSGLGATVEKEQKDQVNYTVELRSDLEAPIKRGQKVGEVVFTVDGQEVGRSNLVAGDDVPKGNIFRVIWDVITRALGRAFSKT
ncbi:MAG TPA: D-alanyl-D-alanine carboxypeptidase [Firmicutes bacterium]|nr:D-alanyl-D-alanine carboxypeptidase [Candidatus Fermentithermobacillaceae bacterium]